MDEIMEAARSANAHDFIMKLPKQYQTELGERGVQQLTRIRAGQPGGLAERVTPPGQLGEVGGRAIRPGLLRHFSSHPTGGDATPSAKIRRGGDRPGGPVI